MEIPVIVIWYDGDRHRASRCFTEHPDSTNPHAFFSGSPEVCDIVAVIAGPHTHHHSTEVFIDEDLVEEET